MEKRNILIVGEEGSGKSTVGNRILRADRFEVQTEQGDYCWRRPAAPWRCVSAPTPQTVQCTRRENLRVQLSEPTTFDEDCDATDGGSTPRMRIESISFPCSGVMAMPSRHHLQQQQECHYYLKVIDTFALEEADFLDEARAIVMGHFDGMHLLIFVVRYNSNPSRPHILEAFHKYFTPEINSITLLVITGCERVDRKLAIENYKYLFAPGEIGKGILPVAFPCIEDEQGPTRVFFQEKVKKDEEALRNLIFQCKEMIPKLSIFQ